MKILMVISPMDDETFTSAHEQYEYMKLVLSPFIFRLCIEVVLVADNASTNKTFLGLFGSVFVG